MIKTPIVYGLNTFSVPNFATSVPRDNFPIVSIPIKELDQQALDDLAEQWLRDLYQAAGKPRPPSCR